MSEQNTYCIIGGNGFLGRHLLDTLKKNQVISIRVLTRQTVIAHQPTAKFAFIQGDLLDQQSLLDFLVPGAIVINLAYLNNACQDNLTAANNLAQACLQRQVKQLLHVSTAMITGKNQDDIISETTVCYPVSEYEINKLAIEHLLITKLRAFIPLTILRPTAIFGVGGKNLLKIIQDYKFDSLFMRKLKYSLLQARPMHLVAVENVVAAIIFLTNQPVNDDYIIADDEFANNHYGFIVQTSNKILDYPKITAFPLPFITKLLPLLLKLRGRSQTNPQQCYSSTKLTQAGFIKPVSFTPAVEQYIQQLLQSEQK